MPPRVDASLIPIAPDLSFESSLWKNNLPHIAGIDEAGRGAWAGPVVAAAVILPDSPKILDQLQGVRDSKQLSPEKRAQMAEKIKQFALYWAVGFSSSVVIDDLGILTANRMAMEQAVNELGVVPDHLIIDALFLPELETSQTSLIKGDQRSLSIAAASILAKTARDMWMIEAHTRYPQYGFNQHKGYGTVQHQQALAVYGVCELHRKSYHPIQQIGNE